MIIHFERGLLYVKAGKDHPLVEATLDVPDLIQKIVKKKKRLPNARH